MTTTLHYDEPAIIRDLEQLEILFRVAFAASCAERLFPAYEQFCKQTGRGDPGLLGEILARVWKHLLGAPMSGEEVQDKMERCVRLIPGEDDEPSDDHQASADDAASAIAYTLRTILTGQSQESAWAARRAYEAADHHVMYRLGIEGEPGVLAHPIVQTELSRQQRDLAQLLEARTDSAALIVCLRDRARAEAPTFFGSSA